MTREENILWHLEMGMSHEIAPGEIRYLLARNEELQRRVERLEKVAERSRSMVDLFIEKVESGAARSKKTYEDALAVREELLALDAKEQDDA